jgi:hypothetical protein
VTHLSINQLKHPGDEPIHQSIKTSRWRTYPSINQTTQAAHLSINQSNHPDGAPIHQSIKPSRRRTYLSINQTI